MRRKPIRRGASSPPSSNDSSDFSLEGRELRRERCAFQRGVLDPVFADRDAETGTGRHRDRPVRLDLDRRIDQIGIEVASARGDVARQREIRQRRQMQVRRAADARFEHAAVPHRNAMRRAQVVKPDRLGKPAHASRLDVDDAAGAGLDRRARDGHAFDRLVETNRRLQPPLQRRMIRHIVVLERLLDHHEVERIEPGEMVRVRRRVGRVGVHHQRDRAEARAYGLHRLEIPAGLDLDLDPAIPRGELALDLRGKIVERLLNADRDARRDAGARTAERAAERLASQPRVEVPRRHLDGGLRHAMAADRLERGEDLTRVREGGAEHARRDEVRDDVPRGLVRLGAVVRILLGDALAVAGCTAAVDAHEDEVFVVDAAEAGLEEMDERELQQTQLQAFDLHCAMISSGALQFRYIAIEGPIGAGKTALAERLGTRLDATVVLEEMENPFLADFYAERPGAALQAQLFYLLNRHRQQTTLQQADLFSQLTICDYLFDKDKIFAYLNLDDNELFIYQRLFDLLARDVPQPDLVVYLQAPTDVLLRRVHSRRMDAEAVALQPDDEYLRELNEAYHHFFFHYTITPLLVVETSQFDSDASDEALDDLIKQIRAMGPGTRYYVPRTK